MTKAELMKEWRGGDGAENPLSLGGYRALYEDLCGVIAAELLGGGEVPLKGLGKLKVVNTPARKGINPRTGEVVEIPAGRKVKFHAAKDFKEAMKAN